MLDEGKNDRAALLLQLGRLKREARTLEERLGIAVEAPLPSLPADIEAAMHRLIADYSADLLSVHAANGDYVFVSPNCQAFFGWKPEELLGRSAYVFFHKGDLARISADHARNLAGEPAQKQKTRYRIRCASGRYRWVETRSCAAGEPGYIVCITRDIHVETLAGKRLERAQKALEKELVGQAYTDALTSLPNRKALEEALEREIERSRRGGKPLAVTLFDIDAFTAANAAWGNHAGDAVLQEVGSLIVAQKRGYDLAGRWGGDEFLVILPETGLAGARLFAERVRQSVEQAPTHGSGRTTLSGGVSAAKSSREAAHLVRDAELALRRAKEGGQNRIEAA
ncbi:MAG TPA: GGDEF domain-containing protein [Thermoanaerobaculia bacterium]|nr:GGDEF domain-containing protein [Thermoanaerobaculia bacterium]